MTLEAKAAAGVRWTGVSSFLTAVLQLLRVVIVARILSPLDFGLMGMVMVVMGTAQAYTDLGISAAIIHRQDATRDQLSSLYWLNIFTGLVVFALVWLSLPLIALLFREPRIVPLLKVVSITFVVVPIGRQFEILLQKELSFGTLAAIEISASLGALAIAVYCGFRGFGVWTLVSSFLTNYMLRTILLAYIGFSRFRPSFHFLRGDLKGYLSFGFFQMGEKGVNYLNVRMDQILIGSLLGARTLGFYHFAFNLTSQPISRVNPVVTRVAFPVLAKVQNDPEKLRKEYVRILGFLTTLNAPILMGFAAVAPLAIPVIFGTKWLESIALIQILCFVSLLRSTCNPVGSLLLAKGRADLGFKWNVTLLACSVPAIYLGGRFGQGIGVALASLVLQIALTIPIYLFLVRPLLGSCAQEYANTILRPIAAAFGMAAVIAFVRNRQMGLPQMMELVLLGALGLGLYVLLLQLFHRKALYEIRTTLFSTGS